MKLISFVIPVYRNEGSLKLTYEEITTVLSKQVKDYDYEFYFVNDGSDDGSLNELLHLREHDKKVKILDLSRNFGQWRAIVAGCSQISGDAVITLSADLQDPVDKIPEMIREYEKGNDIVICHRPVRHDNFIDRFFAYLYYTLMKTSNLKIPKGGFDLYLLSKRANEEFLKIKECNRFIYADIFWIGFPVKLIASIRRKRTIGKSQYPFIKKLNAIINAYFNTSYLPIRLMGIVGLVFALSGCIYAMAIVYSYFNHNTPFQGWAPIMILLLVIGGLIMIMLGIIGEYLWRIYDETKKRPNFIIKKKYE